MTAVIEFSGLSALIERRYNEKEQVITQTPRGEGRGPRFRGGGRQPTDG